MVGKIHLIDEDIDCYLGLGVKQIILSKSSYFDTVFDVMLIDEQSPKFLGEEDILQLIDRHNSVPRNFHFYRKYNSDLLKKHLANFREFNRVPKLELNPHATMKYTRAGGYATMVKEYTE